MGIIARRLSRRLRLIVSALAVIATGLALRFVGPSVGVPVFLSKYGGSALWAAMVYLIVAAIAPRQSMARVGGAAIAVAVLVEAFRLVHTPALDAFRLTLAGKLLIGRVFSLWNIAAYCAGVAVAATLDQRAGVVEGTTSAPGQLDCRDSATNCKTSPFISRWRGLDMVRLLKIALLGLPLVYLGVFATLTVNQRNLLYHPALETIAPAQAGLTDFDTIALKTDDGETLVAWRRAPMDEKAPFIVYFHGNSGSLAERRNRLRAFAQHGYGVLAIEWRGFAGSTGSPTEAGLLSDAEAAYAEARRMVDAKRIVLVGESLGTGVATMLAARHQAKDEAPAALILDSPYDSIVDVARGQYPIFPVSLVLQDTFRADEAIGKVHVPVLMMLGEDDDIIPAAASRRLFALANAPKDLWALPGVGHLAMSSPGALARTIAWIDALPRQ